MEVCNDITEKTSAENKGKKTSAENNLKSGCRKQMQKINTENKLLTIKKIEL